MLIPIINTLREPDLVLPHVLDRMLACGEVHAFERSSGWVVVGRDPIRAARNPFHGHERRRPFTLRSQQLTA